MSSELDSILNSQGELKLQQDLIDISDAIVALNNINELISTFDFDEVGIRVRATDKSIISKSAERLQGQLHSFHHRVDRSLYFPLFRLMKMNKRQLIRRHLNVNQDN